MSKKITRKDFDEIYEETYKIVLKFTIVKCNNIDDINDIIQDTYLELLKILKKKKILEIENTKNYILGIENNIIKRYYKKVKKENIVILNMYDEEDNNLEIKDEFDLEANIINKDNVEKVWNYLKGKDLITTKIFYLYFALGLKISEISDELEVGSSFVKNRIYRTLEEIKKNLGKDVIEND